MANIGSVFLGDVQRVRLTGSTPPASPPPTLSPPSQPHLTTALDTPSPALPAEGSISQEHHLGPTQSLELRVRWLEALIYGAKHDEILAGLHERKPELKRGETLLRAAEHAYRRMNDVASTHDALRKFLSQYEQHAQYLTPAFALSGTLPTIAPPEYADMSPAELAAVAAELEPDIRVADNDMREIEALQKRGVTGAGSLSDNEALRPRLEALLLRHAEDLERAAALEKRVAKIVREYALQVDGLSELFVMWDETLRRAEDRVTMLEKGQEERLSRGYD
ncbi:hypothetical protein EDB86DRAFT_3065641 [Lactarius hatsudake]|nr:hypothetical protein EDB86DRAFT_3067441 [Lactarius hatsudake]KAH8987935.1 hypothetical protein EDB86DRAFT_3065641 [Lactarius hatsudake]